MAAEVCTGVELRSIARMPSDQLLATHGIEVFRQIDAGRTTRKGGGVITMRGGSGLGDALYVRGVAEIMLRQGEQITVCSDYPDVFYGLDISVEPFRRTGINRLAHYALRKSIKETSQWADVCIQAGVTVEPMAINWTAKNPFLTHDIRHRAGSRPLVLVHGGVVPMGRKDGFGAEVLPLKRGFDVVLRGFADCYTVRVGRGKPAYDFHVDADLTDVTSVTDLIDLAQECDGIVGQCSYAVPLAEAFAKPAMFVWSQAGLDSKSQYVRQITPAKVLSRDSSMFVLDTWSDEQIRDEVNAFRLLC